ncbi:leukemia inhibitory factor [Varanus komodoensis]|uniref:Leukemia inhibitory factor n=1 Tax=Varanus komodoensis TaxID=61221 RepID=A0A8D2JH80_VARKO|nr:leukemia inhibitory factor [Varanus komodoensis]
MYTREYQHPSLLRHPGMQLIEKAVLAGVVSLLLAVHCRLVSGKALLRSRRSSMCQNIRPCSNQTRVLHQIQCQVASLNASAQELFEVYLKHQGNPFTNKEELNVFCQPDRSFPSFDNRTSEEKEKLIALYKICAFFNASLGNITKDQRELGNDKEDLLKLLRNTTNTTRGLLANLTCLLCAKYKVSHVDVTYGHSSGTNNFAKKQQGCQVLRKYAEVIPLVALGLGKCNA